MSVTFIPFHFQCFNYFFGGEILLNYVSCWCFLLEQLSEQESDCKGIPKALKWTQKACDQCQYVMTEQWEFIEENDWLWNTNKSVPCEISEGQNTPAWMHARTTACFIFGKNPDGWVCVEMMRDMSSLSCP